MNPVSAQPLVIISILSRVLDKFERFHVAYKRLQQYSEPSLWSLSTQQAKINAPCGYSCGVVQQDKFAKDTTQYK